MSIYFYLTKVSVSEVRSDTEENGSFYKILINEDPAMYNHKNTHLKNLDDVITNQIIYHFDDVQIPLSALPKPHSHSTAFYCKTNSIIELDFLSNDKKQFVVASIFLEHHKIRLLTYKWNKRMKEYILQPLHVEDSFMEVSIQRVLKRFSVMKGNVFSFILFPNDRKNK
ncbi:hypothetical protein V1503_11450 [Bacillus sp. SCS-151]|uniref:hypothetical protein n=1 Tax=Nanhaiella sioensis TaxID=3115293 RepID=UPI0039794078